jgi:hypothetical protein
MVSHFLSGILGALLALNYPSEESQINKITTEALTILKKAQKPLLQRIADEVSRNSDYLMNAKLFGIENGIPKSVAACTALCLAYYGYSKYQENEKINSCSNNQDQKIKDNSNKQEQMQ